MELLQSCTKTSIPVRKCDILWEKRGRVKWFPFWSWLLTFEIREISWVLVVYFEECLMNINEYYHSLSDLLFSFVLEKYIVCEVCGLRSPSFESSSVLHISPTDTPSMQNLILEGLQQKLQKSCSRCNKNTQHIESSYILQPPNYLLLFVNRFRYLNNNIIKDRCPIPLDTTVMLGPLKFNLQATIDHHGPSIDSGHYTASINCCKKTFYCNDHKITEFGITDKNSFTAYIVLYKWIDTWFLDSNRRMGVWSLPRRWHILSIPLTTGRGTSAETCGLDDVFPPDDLGSRPEALC